VAMIAGMWAFELLNRKPKATAATDAGV